MAQVKTSLAKFIQLWGLSALEKVNHKKWDSVISQVENSLTIFSNSHLLQLHVALWLITCQPLRVQIQAHVKLTTWCEANLYEQAVHLLESLFQAKRWLLQMTNLSATKSLHFPHWFHIPEEWSWAFLTGATICPSCRLKKPFHKSVLLQKVLLQKVYRRPD